MKINNMIKMTAIGLTALLTSNLALATPDDLLNNYSKAGAGPFSATAGAAAWQQERTASSAPTTRSCSLCHGTDLSQTGKHAKTGKAIKPMSVAANPERLSDSKKVEKWFRRNCRWTLGRECTPQEKGDFVSYLNQ